MYNEFPPLPDIPADFQVTRESVAKLAAEHFIVMQIVFSGGGDIRGHGERQQRVVLDFVKSLSDEDAQNFENWYSTALDELSEASEQFPPPLQQSSPALRPLSRPRYPAWQWGVSFLFVLLLLLAVTKLK